MDSTSTMGHLLEFARVIAGRRTADLVLEAALPALLHLAGAETAVVNVPDGEGGRPATRAGRDLGPETALVSRTHQLPGALGTLVLAWTSPQSGESSQTDTDVLDAALLLLDAGLERAVAEERVGDLAARVDNAQKLAARFRGLVDSAPDAVLLLGEQGLVLEANQRALELLGGEPRGTAIEEVLPGWPLESTGGVAATSLDGRSLQLDLIARNVDPAEDAPGDDSLVALFLRDASPRLEGEVVAGRLAEAQLRRRQALEINDNVVQGLVAAVYALDIGEVEASMSYLDRTLSSARAMMDDLLDPLDGIGLQPGDLVRTSPAVIGTDPEADRAAQEEAAQLQRSHSVLVVDDAEDLRMLLRARMESYEGLTVVGEAADGVAAVELAAELQPDLVLLDLAMPRMDGLEALPLIRAAVPGVRVIVLSGFNQSTLAQKALEAGADHYVVKGGSMSRLLELVDSLLEPAS
jgi:CheY-like chemotaxis protein/PAS domain-containing protein